MKEPQILPILIEGDPILRLKCSEVAKDYPNLENIIANMKATLGSIPTGAGLAAPQVGYSIRVFMIKGINFTGREGSYVTFINPKILAEKGALKKEYEECLSIPGVTAPVERFYKIRIKFYDEHFNEFTIKFKGFQARLIMHENDHLNGVLFYDRLPDNEMKEIQRKISALHNGIIPNVGYKIKSVVNS